jgi:SNF2 family DNA or RNA helicase
MLTVSYQPAKYEAIQAIGGDPRGGCHVHRLVSRWPGWTRAGTVGKHSLFEAVAHPSAVLPLWEMRHAMQFEGDTKDLIAGIYMASEAGRRALVEEPKVLSDGQILPKRRLLPHQLRAEKCAWAFGCRVLLADDMGLGKTTEAIAIAYHRRRCVIVAPKGLRYVWADEIEACTGAENVHVIDGGPKKREKLIRGLHKEYCQGHGSYARCYVILHYDILPNLSEQVEHMLVDLLRPPHDTAVILDESHAVKNYATKRHQAIASILKKSGTTCRVLCTGTPIRNQVDDLYGQIELIRPGTWVSYADFERRYCETRVMEVSGRGGRKAQVKRIVGSKNLEELNEIVNTVQIRRKKDEVLDLPEMIDSYPRLAMDDLTASLYEEMRDKARFALSQLDDTLDAWDPRAKSAMEQAIRCMQLCQGFVGGLEEWQVEQGAVVKGAEEIEGRPGEYVFPRSVKLQWALDTVSEINEQGRAVVIFGPYNGPLHWLSRALTGVSEHVRFIHGGISAELRHAAVKDLQEGRCRVLLSQVRIAEGWTATAAQDALFLGRDWSPAVNEQAKARLHRYGQKGTVNIYTPILKGTIEERIHRVLDSKSRSAESALTVREVMEAL